MAASLWGLGAVLAFGAMAYFMAKRYGQQVSDSAYRRAQAQAEGLRESFAMQGKAPACVIVVSVERVYTQCSKAVVRSRLWDPAAQIARSELPSMGEIVEAITRGEIDGKAYDEAYPERLRQTIY